MDMDNGYTITLNDYCSYCENFKPECFKADVTPIGSKSKKVLNDIRCKNEAKCLNLALWIGKDK